MSRIEKREKTKSKHARIRENKNFRDNITSMHEFCPSGYPKVPIGKILKNKPSKKFVPKPKRAYVRRLRRRDAKQEVRNDILHWSDGEETLRWHWIDDSFNNKHIDSLEKYKDFIPYEETDQYYEDLAKLYHIGEEFDDVNEYYEGDDRSGERTGDVDKENEDSGKAYHYEGSPEYFEELEMMYGTCKPGENSDEYEQIIDNPVFHSRKKYYAPVSDTENPQAIPVSAIEDFRQAVGMINKVTICDLLYIS